MSDKKPYPYDLPELLKGMAGGFTTKTMFAVTDTTKLDPISLIQSLLDHGQFPHFTDFIIMRNLTANQDWCSRWGQRYNPNGDKFLLITNLLPNIGGSSVEELFQKLSEVVKNGLPERKFSYDLPALNLTDEDFDL